MPQRGKRSLTRDDCLRELVALTRAAGVTVRAADVPNRLLRGIYRYFGSLAAAREAAGLAPRKRLTKWSTERVLAEMRRLSREGVTITYGGLERAGQLALYRAIYFYVGSIRRARQLARVPEPNRRRREREVWDAERVVEEIQVLHESGRSIALTKVDGRLVAAACRYIGSWREAVEDAGFDYAAVRLVRVPYAEAEALEKLRRLAKKKPRMTVTELRRHRLFHPIERFFGSIAVATKRAGIKAWPRLVQERSLSKREVIARIRRRHAAGQPVHARTIQHADSQLFYSATVRFGKWSDALRAARIPAEARAKPVEPRIWTRPMIVAELQRIARMRGRVTQKDAGRVVRAAWRHFGSLRAAAKAAGVTYGRSLSRSSVIAGLRQRARSGHAVDAETVRRDDAFLHDEVLRVFGDWGSAIEAALGTYRPNRTWTAESVVKALRTRKRAGLSLRTTDLMREDFGLYRAAFAHVGSFQEAVKRAGGRPVVRTDWSRKDVLAELVRAGNETRWVTSGSVPQRVYRAAVRIFGSFEAARRAAGVPGPMAAV